MTDLSVMVHATSSMMVADDQIDCVVTGIIGCTQKWGGGGGFKKKTLIHDRTKY